MSESNQTDEMMKKWGKRSKGGIEVEVQVRVGEV